MLYYYLNYVKYCAALRTIWIGAQKMLFIIIILKLNGVNTTNNLWQYITFVTLIESGELLSNTNSVKPLGYRGLHPSIAHSEQACELVLPYVRGEINALEPYQSFNRKTKIVLWIVLLVTKTTPHGYFILQKTLTNEKLYKLTFLFPCICNHALSF